MNSDTQSHDLHWLLIIYTTDAKKKKNAEPRWTNSWTLCLSTAVHNLGGSAPVRVGGALTEGT